MLRFLGGACAPALAWVFLLATPNVAVGQTTACAPWRGEPDPLPSIDSADPTDAEWAAGRVQDLTAEARFVEPSSVDEALRFWEHILCFDPTNPEALQALARNGRSAPEAAAAEDLPPPAPVATGYDALPAPSEEPPVNAVAPNASTPPEPAPPTQVAAAPPPEPQPAPPVAAAPPPEPEPAPALPGEPDALEDVDQEILEIEGLVREAHFRSALSVAGSTRSLLEDLEPAPGVAERRARLEVLTATAQIALGRESDARVSLAFAVRADPDLSLDTATTSPKVIEALDAVRAAPSAVPWDEPLAAGSSQ